jgi:hypothetical protein
MTLYNVDIMKYTLLVSVTFYKADMRICIDIIDYFI